MKLKKWALLSGALLIFGLANIATASFIYNNHEYALTSPGLTWLEAEAEAVAWGEQLLGGGHLVTINDQAEQDWLAAIFPYTQHPWLFVGMNDIAEEGNWVWSSGEPVTYTNWAPGEPNNMGGLGEEEDIAVMNWGPGDPPNYRSWWNDLPNDPPWVTRSLGIMERPIPEPSTILLLTTGLSGMVAYGFRRRKKA